MNAESRDSNPLILGRDKKSGARRSLTPLNGVTAWPDRYRITVVVEDELAGVCITRDSSVVVVEVVEGSFSTTAVQDGNATRAASAKRLRRMLGFIDCAGFAGGCFPARIESCARVAAAIRTQSMKPDKTTSRTQADKPEAVDHLSPPEQNALELSGELEHAAGPEWKKLSDKTKELTDDEKKNGDRE